MRLASVDLEKSNMDPQPFNCSCCWHSGISAGVLAPITYSEYLCKSDCSLPKLSQQVTLRAGYSLQVKYWGDVAHVGDPLAGDYAMLNAKVQRRDNKHTGQTLFAIYINDCTIPVKIPSTCEEYVDATYRAPDSFNLFPICPECKSPLPEVLVAGESDSEKDRMLLCTKCYNMPGRKLNYGYITKKELNIRFNDEVIRGTVQLAWPNDHTFHRANLDCNAFYHVSKVELAPLRRTIEAQVAFCACTN